MRLGERDFVKCYNFKNLYLFINGELNIKFVKILYCKYVEGEIFNLNYFIEVTF